jgi:hypothetical protein
MHVPGIAELSAQIGGGIPGRVHLGLDDPPLLPLEAGHAGHTVEELAVGEAVLAALLRLDEPQDLGQSAICLRGCQHLPLDLLISEATDQVVEHHLVCVVGLPLACHALHLEPPCPGHWLQSGLKGGDRLISPLYHGPELESVDQLVPRLDNKLPRLLQQVSLRQLLVLLVPEPGIDQAGHRVPQADPQPLLLVPRDVGDCLVLLPAKCEEIPLLLSGGTILHLKLGAVNLLCSCRGWSWVACGCWLQLWRRLGVDSVHVEAEECEVLACGGLLVNVILRLLSARGHLALYHVDQDFLASLYVEGIIIESETRKRL